jgi:predicted Rossmann fold flavoprotein
LIPICLQLSGIDGDKLCNQISTEERKKLKLWLKDFRFDISGHRSFNEAIITTGGVNLKEVNPKTLESRLVENLYFAGEVLDIDADTGGFNLQAAFSTGYLAGVSAADITL